MDEGTSMFERSALPNCAIHYVPDAYEFVRGKIMGRPAAGRGFLSGFLRHSGVDSFYCFSRSPREFARFTKSVCASGASHTPARWIPFHRPEEIAEPGCLFRPDPGIHLPAWQRRFVGPRAYSICGITYTLCSDGVMDSIGALATAPLERWDALICASQVARSVVEHVLEEWIAYLNGRLDARAKVPIELPVIPLGVDCAAFEKRDSHAAIRKEIRERLGIGEEEIAVLYVGRLTFHAKAHPLPMYLALEAASQRAGRTVHLIQAGVFPSEAIKREFEGGAKEYCPSVRVHFIEGHNAVVGRLWHAADLFTSLADNIQETFGLAPVEAMAAGLPQVVSDWNGYRDTVRHGVDGFRVSTIAPPPGAGVELARRYAFGEDSYDRYIGYASQSIAVDVGQSADAYAALIANPELRRRMGEAARQRARECFDWSVIIKQYQGLWRELALRRAHAEQSASRPEGSPHHPLREDPFSIFGCYATVTLTPDARLRPAPDRGAGYWASITHRAMTTLAAPLLVPQSERDALLVRLAQGCCTVAQVLEDVPDGQREMMLRTLGWLVKMDLIRVDRLPLGSVTGSESDGEVSSPNPDAQDPQTAHPTEQSVPRTGNNRE